MPHTVSDIAIADIDPGDERYKISSHDQDIQALSNSIKQAGLICPVLLRSVGDTYVIVSGFNRINACIQAQILRIQAIVVDPDTTEAECHIKAIAAAAFKRSLSHAELIVCLTRLERYFNLPAISESSLSVFNEQLNTRYIKDLLAIGKLPSQALQLLREGSLSIKSAKRLCGFSADTIHIFLDLFSLVKASSGKQAEIITFMVEISAVRGIEPAQLYRESNLQDILSDHDQPPGVKTNLVRKFLYEKRFPSIAEQRTQVQNKISGLKLGSGIKFEPPENFEGPNYTLTLSAKNKSEFTDRLQKINTAFKPDNLKDIFPS